MAKIEKPRTFILFRLDAHQRLLVSLLISVAIFFCFRASLSAIELGLAMWIACALTIVILNWIVIFTSHPREVRKIAKLQDSSRSFLFIFIITAAVVSLGAIIYLLKSTKGLGEESKNAHILLAIATVFISWWMVHTIFSLRYAHLYYDIDTDSGKKIPGGGLEFPSTEEPDYLDFVYFGFVVGMTFQVSDVQITSRKLRRLCLLHGLISFAFNTAILALSINVISGLVSQ